VFLLIYVKINLRNISWCNLLIRAFYQMKHKNFSSIVIFLTLSLSLTSCINTLQSTNQKTNSEFSELDSEYSQFKTKALTKSYLEKKIQKWITDNNPKKMLREIEYAKYKHPDILKNIMWTNHSFYVSASEMTLISTKRTDDTSFDSYMLVLSGMPSVAVANNASDITETSFTANWNTASGATGYKLYVDDTLKYTGSNTSFSVTGLIASSSHTYYVKSTNDNGISENSNTINITTSAIGTPSVAVANNASDITETSFTANWNTASGATGYKLYVDNTLKYTGSNTSFSVTGLIASSSHTYYVKSTNDSGESSNSNNISVNLIAPAPSTPTALSATNITTGSFKANWSSVTYATSYILYVDGISKYTGSNTNYSVTGLTANSSHTYYVIASNSSGTSGNSNNISVTTNNIISEFQVNSYTTGNQANPAVTINDNGDFVVIWDSATQDSNTYGVYAQRYNNTGTKVSSEFKVNSYTANNQSNPSIGMDNNGNIVATWQGAGSGDSTGVFALKYDSSNTKVGSEFRVNSSTINTSQNPTVSVAKDSSGNFVIGYNNFDGTLYNVYTQRYNNSGSLGQALINSGATGYSHTPIVSMDYYGSFLVSYLSANNRDGSGHAAYARRFDFSTTTYSSEFRTNTYTTDSQAYPSVAMNNSGNFVIAWGSNGQDGSLMGVYAQRYDNTGTKIGSEFRVNTYTTGTQSSPSVGIDDNGNFVVVWQGAGQDGDLSSEYNVYAQRFDSNENKLGSEFRINAYTTGNQLNTRVAMNASGEFVVTWENDSTQDGSGYGIYAKSFYSNGDVK